MSKNTQCSKEAPPFRYSSEADVMFMKGLTQRGWVEIIQRWWGRRVFPERGDQWAYLRKRRDFKMGQSGDIFLLFFEQFRSQEILKSNVRTFAKYFQLLVPVCSLSIAMIPAAFLFLSVQNFLYLTEKFYPLTYHPPYSNAQLIWTLPLPVDNS